MAGRLRRPDHDPRARQHGAGRWSLAFGYPGSRIAGVQGARWERGSPGSGVARGLRGLYRALSPFPSYLASAWLDGKRLLAEPSFITARDELNRRGRALLAGLPVRDHRAILKDLSRGTMA